MLNQTLINQAYAIGLPVGDKTVIASTSKSIPEIVASSTLSYYEYIADILPTLLVFAVIVGVLFFAIRWVWSAIRGHGFRA